MDQLVPLESVSFLAPSSAGVSHEMIARCRSPTPPSHASGLWMPNEATTRRLRTPRCPSDLCVRHAGTVLADVLHESVDALVTRLDSIVLLRHEEGDEDSNNPMSNISARDDVVAGICRKIDSLAESIDRNPSVCASLDLATLLQKVEKLTRALERVGSVPLPDAHSRLGAAADGRSSKSYSSSPPSRSGSQRSMVERDATAPKVIEPPHRRIVTPQLRLKGGGRTLTPRVPQDIVWNSDASPLPAALTGASPTRRFLFP